MKWFLVFWGGPILLLGSWYGLSYYDMSFGIFMLTRQAHDLVFQVYGNVLGIPPETIPPLVLKAIIVDSIVLYAIIAFRRRARIIAWWKRRQGVSSERKSLSSEDSLSRAP
ncbi:DUF6105 family protein [Rhizobiaceae bacterium n13]|uniref:DUF6105 family protein n=1 Tax=Ferirhizobium litorale TaxID=2927786 RepID=A0AAE3U632_9HYPH|nr:DUF6105 family protein [Fererhizobium litorale]MDI7864397.1 DUF6105 family protein [Fererhizobium litorale]MDI7924689.1 DUF6105 family protein [Fererhizobium litorale]